MTTLKTPRGTLKITEEFATSQEAEANGYGIYFTEGDIDIYIKPIPDKMYCLWFAIVKH